MKTYADIPTLDHTLSTESGVVVLESTEWGGEEAQLLIEMNGCTGGLISIVVVAKSK